MDALPTNKAAFSVPHLARFACRLTCAIVAHCGSESHLIPLILKPHIPVGSGVAGFLFVFATVFIFAVGIPAIRGLLVITGILGILGSGLLFYWHKRHALKIQSLHPHEEKLKR
jgi:hypothetical protein